MRLSALLLLTALPGAPPAVFAQSEPAPAYVLIVHKSNQSASLTREQVGKVFLKRMTVWPDGRRVLPVDLAPASPTRERFSRDVHRKGVPAVKSYWQHMIFSGRGLPPVELESDEAVIAYVSAHPEAIGYVSAEAPVTGRVKPVRVVP